MEKVRKVILEQDLVTLAKYEWVTIRNVIVHGKAVFIPSKASIRFTDRNREVFLTLKQVYIEAINIYLANQAMLMVRNILQEASLIGFKEQLALLRASAQQKLKNHNSFDKAHPFLYFSYLYNIMLIPLFVWNMLSSSANVTIKIYTSPGMCDRPIYRVKKVGRIAALFIYQSHILLAAQNQDCVEITFKRSCCIQQ